MTHLVLSNDLQNSEICECFLGEEHELRVTPEECCGSREMSVSTFIVLLPLFGNDGVKVAETSTQIKLIGRQNVFECPMRPCKGGSEGTNHSGRFRNPLTFCHGSGTNPHVKKRVVHRAHFPYRRYPFFTQILPQTGVVPVGAKFLK